MQNVEIKLPVHFFSAGQFVASKGWVHPKRCIDSSVLFLVQSGNFVVWEDDRRMVVREREMIILQAGHIHTGEYSDGDVPPVYYWAHFLSDDGPNSTSSNRILLRQHQPCDNYDKVTVYFHQLINESRSSMELPISCDYLMSLILIQMLRLEREQNVKMLYTRMLEYMRMNYRHDITLKQLTHVFPYSTDYLSRVFKRNAGISIRKHLHQLRLTEAKRRLLTTLDTIKEIANDCGYSNDKFFITTFTKYEGVTPTQYRNLFSKLHQNDK